MIISHSKGVAFWKIPRTGSSTVEMLLRLTAGLDTGQDVMAETHFFPTAYNFDTMPDRHDGAPGRRRAHITPQTAIDRGFITQSQYDAYDNFCMIRDPVAKFISLYALAFPRRAFVPTDIWADIRGRDPGSALFRSQSEYLTLGNITPLPFSSYEQSVHTILTAFGAPIPDAIPKITRTNHTLENHRVVIVTPQERAAIESFYPDDLALNF